jgi:hypothetical protein
LEGRVFRSRAQSLVLQPLEYGQPLPPVPVPRHVEPAPAPIYGMPAIPPSAPPPRPPPPPPVRARSSEKPSEERPVSRALFPMIEAFDWPPKSL